jgi:hypothetical protein
MSYDQTIFHMMPLKPQQLDSNYKVPLHPYFVLLRFQAADSARRSLILSLVAMSKRLLLTFHATMFPSTRQPQTCWASGENKGGMLLTRLRSRLHVAYICVEKIVNTTLTLSNFCRPRTNQNKATLALFKLAHYRQPSRRGRSACSATFHRQPRPCGAASG